MVMGDLILIRWDGVHVWVDELGGVGGVFGVTSAVLGLGDGRVRFGMFTLGCFAL